MSKTRRPGLQAMATERTIRSDEPTPDASDTEEPHQEPAPESDTPASETPRPKAAAKPRLGIAFPDQATFDEAKAAYLVATYDPGGPGSFQDWLTAAIHDYVALGAARRRREVANLPDLGPINGPKRTFIVDAALMDALSEALREDSKAGRWVSMSRGALEAIRLTTEQTRERNGGELPEPPKRLTRRSLR